MTITPPVAPGTAENLARLAYLRTVEVERSEELDAIAYFLIGDVGDPMQTDAVWQQLIDVGWQLWHLTAGNFDDEDLDELTDEEWERSSFATRQQEIDARYVKTRERLAHQIEHAIHLARYDAAEQRRKARTAVPA